VERHLPELALIDRTKVQAELLVPVVDAMAAVIGRAAALDVVRDALRPAAQADARRLRSERGSSAAALMAQFEGSGTGDSVSIEWHELTDDAARLDVTRCEFAEFFRSIDQADLGRVLVCEGDRWFADALGDVDFERTGTLMDGADRCDFRYRRRDGPEPTS
jgi:predicted ArsR family transcriptional regulator